MFYLTVTNYFWPFVATFLLGIVGGFALAVIVLRAWMPSIIESILVKLKSKKEAEENKPVNN